MNVISKYFWNQKESALRQTKEILKDPSDSRFAGRMVIFLSRCDKPKELFSVLAEHKFVRAWPDIRRYWLKSGQSLYFRDWWETIYEQLLEIQLGRQKKVIGATPVLFKRMGTFIKDARVSKGLSQKQLAFGAGMKQPDISKIEEGRKNITLYTLFRLCKILEIKKIEVELS